MIIGGRFTGRRFGGRGIAIKRTLVNGSVQLDPQIVSHGSVSFSAAEGYSKGNLLDGTAYIVIPATTDLSEPTPAQTLENTKVINGAQINPGISAGQGYDERADDAQFVDAPYDGALTADTWPATVAQESVVVKVVSKTGPLANTDQRKGLPDEVAACFFLNSTPAPNTFIPPIGWPGRTTLPREIIDVDAAAAAMPSYPVSWHAGVPSMADMLHHLDRYNPLYAQSYANKSEHYSQFMVEATTDDYNYGREIAKEFSNAYMALISDAFTVAEKKQLLIPIFSMACAWYYSFTNNASWMDENGGHFQFHFLPMALFMYFTGRTAELADMGDTAKFAGNLGQAVQITAADVSNSFVPHDSLLHPYPWRKRTISNVAGTTLTVPVHSSGKDGDPSSNAIFNGMTVRTLDGSKTALISTTGYPSGSSYEFNIVAQPGSPFVAGDVVYCEPPAGVTPAEGDFEWSLRGRRHWGNFNPMPDASYRLNNRWAPQILALKAMGIWHASWDVAAGYVERANTADTPTAADDHPVHYDVAWHGTMWNDYWGHAAGTAIAPSQFGTNDWSVDDAQSPSGGTALVTISNMPANGGTAFTDIEYQVDGGAWISSGLRDLGTFAIPAGFTDGVSGSVAIRGVTLTDEATPSASKSVTTSTLQAYFDIDLTDFSTLFQDTAGTTPVTAAGQRVRRINDAAGSARYATSANGAVLEEPATGVFCLAPNGVDEGFVTSGFDMTAHDQWSCIMGRALGTVGADQILMEWGQKYWQYRPAFLMTVNASGYDVANNLANEFASNSGFSGYASNDSVAAPAVLGAVFNMGGTTRDTECPFFRRDGVSIKDTTSGTYADLSPAGYVDAQMYLFHRGEAGGSLWFDGKFYGMRFHRSALDQTALVAEEAIMAARTGT